MFAPSDARPHGGCQAGRHLRMIICDGGSLWQRLRRVIRISPSHRRRWSTPQRACRGSR